MRAGEQARGGKGKRVVVNDEFNFSGGGVEGGRADGGASSPFVDRHVWLFAEKTSVVYLDRVEDSDFVAAKNLSVSV